MTYGTGHWLPGGESNPSTASLEDLIFYWSLVGQFPDFSVAVRRRPSNAESSEAGAEECLDRLQCHGRAAEGPDFEDYVEVR